MSIEACIFDLDGVIVDTAKYHYLAWKRLADELNIDLSIEDNERLKGVNRLKALDIILGLGNLRIGEEIKLLLMEKKNEWYLEYINKMDESEILPGAKNLLDELRSKKVKVALGSASKNARTILQKVNLIEKFDVIIDGNKVKNTKPDPEVFVMAAESLGVEPSKCVVFEDAKAGVEAGKNANMTVIGIGHKEQLLNADYNFKGLHELDYSLINSMIV